MPWLEPDAHVLAVEAAREIVLRRLDRCPAPRAVLAALLERKEVDPGVAQEVLDRLEKAGVIDDAAYAAMVARTRMSEKGAGRRAIAEELRRKGLREADIAAAVDEISDDDELQAATRLAVKKLRTLARYDAIVRRRRTLAVLARKGYSGYLAHEAYAQACAQLGTDDDAPAGCDEADISVG